ncbi:MAG: AgmX/PglI C-terminal domain-containing protein [Myxococcales bacterium]|nr:AgmX/PglI C-terminal domain-containing protein [Myxococcales bacterium]
MRRAFAGVWVALAAGCGAAPITPRSTVQSPVPHVMPANVPRTPPSSALRAAIRAAALSPTLSPAPPDPAELAPIASLVREPPEPQPGSRGSRLPADSVRFTIRKSAGRFRGCSRRAPHAEGRVVVDLAIGPDGTVAHAAEAETTLPSRTVRRCVLERAFELKFPAAGGWVQVRYPFVFVRRAPSHPDPLREPDSAAAPPPPGFEAAMLAGLRASPKEQPAPSLPARPRSRPPTCPDDDPLCDDL